MIIRRFKNHTRKYQKISLPVFNILSCPLCGLTILGGHKRKTGFCKPCNKDLRDTWESRKLRLLKMLGGKCIHCGITNPDVIHFFPLLNGRCINYHIKDLLQKDLKPICLNCLHIFHKITPQKT